MRIKRTGAVTGTTVHAYSLPLSAGCSGVIRFSALSYRAYTIPRLASCALGKPVPITAFCIRYYYMQSAPESKAVKG